MNKLGKYRLPLVLLGLVVVAGASLPAFMTASCLTRPQTPAEIKALENLRTMTRGGVLPSEEVVARIESDFPRTKAAALARLVRARIRINTKDFAGAASLLDWSVIRDHSALGDYALFMRAGALEQAGKTAEARVVYEQLLDDYPTSSRARESALRAANIMMRSGAAAGVPTWLKDLAAQDDAAALLLIARAYEQSADTTRALASYRRLYFYAPASAESAEAATAISRLTSTAAAPSPATADEAIARADRLFDAKRFADASQAYADAFAKFPNTANAQAQLRRVIAAASARKTADAVSSLNAIPASAGETRAEALYNVAQVYARTKQWVRLVRPLKSCEEVSPLVRYAASAGECGPDREDANNDADASYFLARPFQAITIQSRSLRRSSIWPDDT